MINKREHAICQRRGHAGILSDSWTQCKCCKAWIREVRKIEERESEPPEAELHPSITSRRSLDALQRDLKGTQNALGTLAKKTQRRGIR